MRLTAQLCTLLTLLFLCGAALAQGYDPLKPKVRQPQAESEVPLNADFEDLPDTPGVEETYYLCTGCHSTAIIKQQHIPDAQWDYLWTWMIEKQGMPETDEETKAIVLGYVKQHFSSER
jgi:cytochrome c